MNTTARHQVLLTLLILCTALAMQPSWARGLTQVYYPTQDQAQFTVAIPSDWELTPQGEEGAEDYFEIEGPNGLELSFRVVPGANIDKAVKDHIEYLRENFTEIELGDSKETKINGMDAIILPAKGLDEDEVARDLGAGWFQLRGGAVGELWYNVEVSDSAGKNAATAVLNSLRIP